MKYKYMKPGSHHNRLTALKRIAQKGAQDADAGITYLRPETVAQIAALVPQFATASTGAKEAKSAQAVAVTAAEETVASVIQYIRHIWVAVKQRTGRKELPAGLHAYYGLPINGKSPKIDSQDGWLTQAEGIIAGEAAAVAAGYPALVAPTVSQLQIKLTAAKAAVSQREAAKLSYDNHAAELNNLSQLADRLIAKAMRELRAALGTETAARRRDIMRDYGARFSQITESAPVVAEAAAMESLAAPAAMSLIQPYAAASVNGNGTAVRV